jgi:hypothetical protein
MPRHLQTCRGRTEAAAESDRKRGRAGKLTHLRVSDWSGDFWLDLEMKGSATLQDLDRYLRAIWLECCGHLSLFSTGGWSEEDQLPNKTRIDQILDPGVQILHIYDFGTSSETFVKGVAVREGMPTTSRPIALMARNNPPELICMECDQPASGICIECVYEDDKDGLLCRQHVKTHPHRDYGDPMPVVNSPRMGMCGYEGPAEPPY